MKIVTHPREMMLMYLKLLLVVLYRWKLSPGTLSHFYISSQKAPEVIIVQCEPTQICVRMLLIPDNINLAVHPILIDITTNGSPALPLERLWRQSITGFVTAPNPLEGFIAGFKALCLRLISLTSNDKFELQFVKQGSYGHLHSFSFITKCSFLRCIEQ